MGKTGRGGRRNQKLNRSAAASSSSSSAAASSTPTVEKTLPEDLIDEILCRTPVKSLVRFRNEEAFVALWNPSINMWKPIRIPSPKIDWDRVGFVTSVGLGFVAQENDFRIVRIVPVLRHPYSRECWSRVEIYSASSDTWTNVDKEDCVPFWPNLPNCSFILKGIPYFVGVDLLPEDLETYNPYLHEILAAFDPLTRSYKKIWYPQHVKNKTTCVHPLNWKDSVAALVQSPGEYPNPLVDMYVLDENDDKWTKIYTIEHAFEGLRILQCLTTGEIVLETWKGGDISKRVPYFCYPETRDRAWYNSWFDYLDPLWGESYRHIESLVCVKGMEITGKDENKKSKSKKNWTDLLSKDLESVLRLKKSADRWGKNRDRRH